MTGITTLAALKAAAATALVRADFTDRIATAVPLAEAWLNRNLRLRSMQSDEPLTIGGGQNALPLPAGFLEPLALFRTTPEGRRALRFRPAGFETRAVGEAPEEWTVEGGLIVFPAPSDALHQLTFRMLKRFALADDGDSNTLLETWPDLYLMALLTAVTEIYLTDDPRLMAWKMSRDELLSEVRRKEARAGAAAATLAADPAILSRSDVCA